MPSASRVFEAFDSAELYSCIQTQRPGVMAQVGVDHSGHKEIAVVVALMHGEFERLAAAFGRRFEVADAQLLLEEGIGGADIHKQGVVAAMTILDQGHAIPGPPACLRLGAVSEKMAEGLLPPGAGAGMADRCHRRNGTEALRVTQAQHQGSMTAHGMTSQPQAVGVQGQGCTKPGRELLHYIAVHPVVLVPWLLLGIQVEAGAMAEIPVSLWITGHRITTGAGVGHDQGQPKLGGQSLGARLLHRVFIAAGETRQPDQCGTRLGSGT